MNLVGNESLKQRLPQNLSHAYLLGGELGSGRGLLLKHLIKTALCLEEGEKPCGTCRECLLVEGNNHPDVGEFGLDKLLNVEGVRLLRQDVFIRPHQGKRKIYVIHQGDKLNHNGQNALLKILEEPPPYALFFLMTGEGCGMLETIRSRCQQLVLRPVTQGQAVDYLSKRFPQAQNIAQVAEQSQGFLGRAIAALTPVPTEETGLKEVKSAKKTKAEPPKEDSPLELWAKNLESALFSGNELLLLEACQPLRKLDKIQSLALLELLRSRLSRALCGNLNRNILAWIESLEDISSAISANVKGEQIACWLTARLSQKGEPT